MIARPIANMIAFVANVRVGPIFEIANSRKLLTPMRDSPNGHMAGLHCGECLIFLAPTGDLRSLLSHIELTLMVNIQLHRAE